MEWLLRGVLRAAQQFERAGLSRGLTGRRLAGFLFMCTMTGGLALIVPTLPWQQAIAHVTPAWLAAVVAIYLLEFPLWAAEWRLLTPTCQPVGWARMLEITAISSAAQNTLPLFGGQASALVLLVVRAGLTRAAAISVLAIDQLITGVAKLVVLGIAVLVMPVPPWIREGAVALLGIVIAFLAVMLVAAHGGQGIRWLALRLRSPARRVALALAEWTFYMEPMRSIARASSVLGLGLGKKAVEVVAVLAVQQACGIAVDLGQAVLVVAALGLSTVLPRLPANLGVYEATILLIYEWCGVPTDAALAAAILQHAAFLLPAIGGGYVILLARQLHSQRPPG
jgi:uncharacterized membrane protein YbhN (UPF0104 family)